METDFPDVSAALALKARVTVPDLGQLALRETGWVEDTPGERIKQALRAGLDSCRTVIWTADVLLGLSGQSVQDSLALVLLEESVRDGMTGEAELWVANHGGLITTSDEPLVIEGLLLIRHPAARRCPTLPDEPGVLVAALAANTPQLVFWWPVGHALAAVVSATQAEYRNLALPLLAVGHWAGWGLAARAAGALLATEVVADATDELALVVCPAVTRETAH